MDAEKATGGGAREREIWCRGSERVPPRDGGVPSISATARGDARGTRHASAVAPRARGFAHLLFGCRHAGRLARAQGPRVRRTAPAAERRTESTATVCEAHLVSKRGFQTRRPAGRCASTWQRRTRFVLQKHFNVKKNYRYLRELSPEYPPRPPRGFAHARRRVSLPGVLFRTRQTLGHGRLVRERALERRARRA